MADKMTVDEFAASIKAKYPQYSDIPNMVLASKMLTKYPQYKQNIKTAREVEAESDKAAKAKTDYVGAAKSGIYDAAKNIVTSLPQSIQTRPGESNSTVDRLIVGPAFDAARGIKHMGQDIIQGGKNATAARRESARQGENLSGQILSSAENLPLIGGMVKQAEKGGPTLPGNLTQFTPDTMRAVAEGSTYAAAPKMTENAAEFAKLGGKATSVAKGAVGEAARSYAERTARKMTGVLPDEKTGISVPSRVAESTRKAMRINTAIKKYAGDASRATAEVDRLGVEATQKGVALTPQESGLIYKLMDTMTKRSSNLKAMQEFTGLGLDQLKSPLWDATKRTPYINAEQMLGLRRDLDELVNYERKSGKESPVSAAAHKVRTELDQNLDKRVPGWKDANEKASASIQASEALTKRRDAEVFKSANATLTDVLSHPVSTITAGFGAYELAEMAGAPHYVNYIAAIASSTIAHRLYESLPSQTARIAMADSLADMLIGKRAPKGPSSYAPSAGPGLPAPQPPRAGAPSPQGGPPKAQLGLPQQAGAQTASSAPKVEDIASQAFREAARKAGKDEKWIEDMIHRGFADAKKGQGAANFDDPNFVKPIVTRAPNFSMYDEYIVKVGDKTARIYRDPESGIWYDAADSVKTKGGVNIQEHLGFNKQEAVDKIVKKLNNK